MREVTSEEIGISLLIVLTVFNSISSVVGTLGNALVLTAIYRNENLQSIPDLFIFSLAFSDFIVVVLYQPMNAAYFTNLEAASENTAFVYVRSFLGHMSLIASVTNIFSVTIERLISIRFPLKYDVYVTQRRAQYAFILVWSLSLLAGAAHAKAGVVNPAILQAYFLLILLGTVIMYIYILIMARKLENRVIVPQEMNQEDGAQKRKAARTIAIILGFALACWLPFLLTPAFVNRVSQPAKFFRVFYTLLTISTLNSSINPFIYCVRSERYRRAFAKLLGLLSP